MARAHLREVIQDATGIVQAGVALTFYERDGTTPLTTPIYKTVDGTATYTTPELITDSNGGFEGWSKLAKRVQIAVAGLSDNVVTLFKADETDNTVRVTDYGAVADCKTTAGNGTTSRGSTTLTVFDATLTSADVGKTVMVHDRSAPSYSSTGTTTNGSTTLSVGSAAFVAGDVGKIIYVTGAGVAGALLSTTIAAYISSTSVTLATTASTSVAGTAKVKFFHPVYSSTISSITSSSQAVMSVAATSSIILGEMTIGTDNTAAIQAAINGLPSTGGVVEFPGGATAIYGVTSASPIALVSNLTLSGTSQLRRMADNGITMLTLAAGLTRVTIDGLVIDQNNLESGRNIVASNAVSSVVMRNVRLTNLTAVDSSVYFAEGTSLHDGVLLQDCTFERLNFAKTNDGLYHQLGFARLRENIQQIRLSNVTNVTVERCVFNQCGALSVNLLNTGLTARNVKIRDNTFLSVPITTCWVLIGVPNVTSDYEIVEVSGNTFRDCGTWMEKGCIDVGFGDATCTIRGITIRNNVIKGWGYSGVSGGEAEQVSERAIRVGNGCVVDGCVVEGNLIDGSDTSNTNPAGGNYGIVIDDHVKNFVVKGNVVQRTGQEGIGICAPGNSTTAVPPQVGTISGNTVTLCSLVTTSGEKAGGIQVWAGQILTIEGNTTYRCGNTTNAGNDTAGIAIAGLPGNIATNIVITGNTVIDGATPQQDYGIRVGSASGGLADADQPTKITVTGNNVRGAGTANLFYITATDRDYTIHNNPGAEGANNEATLFRRLRPADTVWNFGPIADGAQATTTVTCTGAEMGDPVTVSHSGLDTGGAVLYGQVTSADTVTVTLYNKTGGNLSKNGSLRVAVDKYQ